MTTLLIDDKNDLFLDPFGDWAVASDNRAIGTIIQAKISTLFRDNYDDLFGDIGIPFFGVTTIELEETLTDTITSVDGVERIEELVVTFDKSLRLFAYRGKVLTSFGLLEVTEGGVNEL